MPSTKRFQWDTKERLGNGGYGIVYKGVLKSKPHFPVAIKQFKSHMTKFYREREANVLKALNHPNIVKFMGFERYAHYDTLAMEFCDGGDLQRDLERNSQRNGMSTNEFMLFFHHLLNGLKYLAGKNIVHRDIKPANILISIKNGRKTYKLGDFGAARVLQPNELYTSLYGTTEYLHPNILENLHGDLITPNHAKVRHFNTNHELWSVGVTIYEAATGQLPFNAKNGLRNPRLLYKMIMDKGRGHIAAMEFDDGSLRWCSELPASCRLQEDLKMQIKTLLEELFDVSLNFYKSFDFFKSFDFYKYFDFYRQTIYGTKPNFSLNVRNSQDCYRTREH